MRHDSAVPETVRSLLEASTDAAVVLDADRRILYYNPAYEVVSGNRGRAMQAMAEQGKRCYEVFPLEICETACVGCRARELGRPLRVEMVSARRGDGEDLTLAVTSAPLSGGMIVETYRDITADVRIQRKYKGLLEHERRVKETLEDEVRARTEDLRRAGEELKRTHAQLIHQEKMSSLGRLVAGVAHELNNPINFVYGNVDFLGRYMDDLLSLVALYETAGDALPVELRRAVERRKEEIELDFLVEDSRKLIRSIRSGAERTASIVRDLKTFSRTSTGSMQEADLVSGVETTLNLLAPVLKNRISVVREFAQPHPRVVCHIGHINQVFMNILTNAAQAIPGEGTITVAIQPVGRESVEVRIQDSGRGVAPDILEKIFDPFFTTKEVGEGTGLGLAISESIVAAHGGTITCDSRLGEGAMFTVLLPIRPGERP